MSFTPPIHDPARELREQLPQDGWRRAILEIGSRHGLASAEPTPFQTGSDVVWALGEFVVKLTAPCWTAEIAAEARNLRQVHGRLGVKTPALYAQGELGGWPYVVMERVPGVSLSSVWSGLERSERLRLAAAIGGLARELHGLANTLGEPWEPFWKACRTDVARRHAAADVPQALLAEIEPFLAAQGELDDGSRVLLHTELYGEHVLVEPRAGRFELSSCIDFADGRIGPRGYEFAACVELLFDGEAGLARALLLGYGYEPGELTPEHSERLLAWNLCHRFGRLQRMLRAALPQRPASLRELAQCIYGLGEGPG